jgi:hypothetical protein
VKNQKTGVTVEIRPTPVVLKLLPAPSDESLQAGGHGQENSNQMQQAEIVARKILAMSQDEIMLIKKIP